MKFNSEDLDAMAWDIFKSRIALLQHLSYNSDLDKVAVNNSVVEEEAEISFAVARIWLKQKNKALK